MDNDRAEIKDSREDLPIFIHSALDDYGLSAIEFRVYARLARRCGRGSAFESVPNMAKDFEVADRTIQRSLKVLVKANLISETIRPGKPTLYILNPQKVWHSQKRLKAIREEVFNKRVTGDTTTGGDMRDGGVVTPQHRVVVTPQTDEGTPSEGTPIKREQRARGAIAVFSEIYGHAPHLPGQAEIEGADVDDLELFRSVAKQCHANLTPAKNVGTICRMYKEQRQRALDDEKRRAARASPSVHSPPVKLARVEACSLCDSNGQREVRKDGQRFMVKCKHEGLTDESKHAA